MSEEKSPEFYKSFYEENRVAILQYNSLRKHFHKLIDSVLGGNYYNMAMDVYEADRICCEDIAKKVNVKPKGILSLLFKNKGDSNE